MPKVLVGAPTYNTQGRIRTLLESIRRVTPKALQNDMGLVIVDDGSPMVEARDEAEMAAVDFGAEFIQHEENKGIPTSWNDLTRHQDAEIVVLFNDDIEVIDPMWLESAIFFLENNPDIGVLGWPTINTDPNQIDPETGKPKVYHRDDDVQGKPGACGAPVGCSFAFRREDFDAIGGFWDELISFYEETDFGFEMWKMGRRNFMLPWPPVIHWHSQTFAKNSELTRIEVHKGEPYFESIREVIAVGSDAETLVVGRMDRSRIMFAEKWGCEDKRHTPQNALHEKYIVPIEPIELSWITPQGVCKEMIK